MRSLPEFFGTFLAPNCMTYTSFIQTLFSMQPNEVEAWLKERNSIFKALFLLSLCSAIYGLVLGWSRAPLMGFYVAIKFPLLILLTLSLNGLLNGFFAKLFDAPFSIRESAALLLLCFCLTSIILAAFAPLAAFMVVQMPAQNMAKALEWHHLFLLTQVCLIAIAGWIGHAKLWRFLRMRCGRPIAWRLFLSWMLANLFLGAQLSWNLRPFFGSPYAPIAFLRPDAFQGSFYESIARILF